MKAGPCLRRLGPRGGIGRLSCRAREVQPRSVPWRPGVGKLEKWGATSTPPLSGDLPSRPPQMERHPSAMLHVPEPDTIEYLAPTSAQSRPLALCLSRAPPLSAARLRMYQIATRRQLPAFSLTDWLYSRHEWPVPQGSQRYPQPSEQAVPFCGRGFQLVFDICISGHCLDAGVGPKAGLRRRPCTVR